MELPPKELLEELECPYHRKTICVKRLVCMGEYCGQIILNKLDADGKIIETYKLKQENGSLIIDNSN